MRHGQGQVNEGFDDEVSDHNNPSHLDSARMSQAHLSVISIEVVETGRPYEALLGQRDEVAEGEGLPSYLEACSMDMNTEYQ